MFIFRYISKIPFYSLLGVNISVAVNFSSENRLTILILVSKIITLSDLCYR